MAQFAHVASHLDLETHSHMENVKEGGKLLYVVLMS